MLKREYEDYERVHDLLRSVDGQHYCTRCQLSWSRQPKTFCAGAPVYHYGAWPEDLYTRTQLRRMKYWPRDLEQPDGAYFIRKSPYRRWLYRLSEAKPWRVPTPAQQEAIAKMHIPISSATTTINRMGSKRMRGVLIGDGARSVGIVTPISFARRSSAAGRMTTSSKANSWFWIVRRPV